MFSIKHTWSAKTVSGIAAAALVASMFVSLVPAITNAAVISSVDSFGSSNTNTVPGWTDSDGNGQKARVDDGSSRSGSATSQHARLREGAHITKTINTSGHQNIVLKYYWRGDNDADGNSDNLKVYWKKASDATFLLLNTHQLDGNETWSSQVSSALPAAANNTSINIRFEGASNDSTEEARVDDVSLEGNIIPAPVENTLALCSDSLDNDNDGQIDHNDSGCASFLPKLTVTKTVINDGPNTPNNKVVADFILSVGSTQVTSNVQNAFVPGSYTVSETGPAGYVATFGGDCNSSGNVSLAMGQTKACSITNNDEGTVPPPVDVCSNLEGNQASVPEGYDEVGGICTEQEPTESEACDALQLFLDIDSCDETTLELAICPIVATNPGSLGVIAWALSLLGIDLEEDIDCSGGGGDDEDPTPAEQCALDGKFWDGDSCEPIADCDEDTETYNAQTNTCTPNTGSGDQGGNDSTPKPKVSRGGGGGSIVYCSATRTTFCKERSGGGEVLGASTDNMCSPLITTYLGLGKANNAGEVAKLQVFLNNHMSAGLPINGSFDDAVKAAVEAFQLKYETDVLAPWLPFGLASNTATGYVYKTTQWMINKLNCSTLNAPMPILP